MARFQYVRADSILLHFEVALSFLLTDGSKPIQESLVISLNYYSITKKNLN